MESNYTQEGASRPSFTPLPAHSDKLVWSILVTVFCCLIGGIIAIVKSSQSNSLYTSAMVAQDEQLRASLLAQSEEKNKAAGTWILVSVISGLVVVLLYVVFVVLLGISGGIMENLLDY